MRSRRVITLSAVFHPATKSIVYSVGVTTQQDAGLQLLEKLISANVDAVQCTKPVAEVFLHRGQELVLSLAAAGRPQDRVVALLRVGLITAVMTRTLAAGPTAAVDVNMMRDVVGLRRHCCSNCNVLPVYTCTRCYA